MITLENKINSNQSEGKQDKETVSKNIKDYGTTSVPEAPLSNIHCLTIIGQIEGHWSCHQNKQKYEHLISVGCY